MHGEGCNVAHVLLGGVHVQHMCMGRVHTQHMCMRRGTYTTHVYGEGYVWGGVHTQHNHVYGEGTYTT